MCDRCYIEELKQLVIDGEVSEETVNTAVKRILRVKFAIGLFERPYRENFSYDREKHLENSRKLAIESMVLLKNNNVLPLKKDTKIALMGPFTHEKRSLLGSWVLDGDEEETPSLFEAMTNILGEDNFDCQSNSRFYDDTNYVYPNADVVVMALGESNFATGENRAVSDISLSLAQRELIDKIHATGKKIVGVFFCGRPIAMEGVADKLDAVLYAWHSGSETANAVCDILFGNAVPSGKTAVTFPRKSGHIPLYYNVTSSGRPVDCYYNENPQNCYLDSTPTPYYPFGYGLSYTTFDYGDIKLNKNSISLEDLKSGNNFEISINISNSGDFDGKETVQLYIRDKVASIMRPIRELKQFKKPFIRKGETVKVNFSLGYKDLGFYDENGNYLLEKGEFQIFIGENCLTEKCITVTVE